MIELECPINKQVLEHCPTRGRLLELRVPLAVNVGTLGTQQALMPTTQGLWSLKCKDQLSPL